jgi:hypothetical protein
VGGDYELERKLDGGIHLVVERFSIADSPNYGNKLCLEATVTSEEDAELSIEGESEAYDSNGGRYSNSFGGGRQKVIGNEQAVKRKIIGGVPTKFYIFYETRGDYKLAEKYPSVTFSVNGKELTFRDVPGK